MAFLLNFIFHDQKVISNMEVDFKSVLNLSTLIISQLFYLTVIKHLGSGSIASLTFDDPNCNRAVTPL